MRLQKTDMYDSVCYPTVIYMDKVSVAPEELFLRLFCSILLRLLSLMTTFLCDLAFSYRILTFN